MRTQERVQRTLAFEILGNAHRYGKGDQVAEFATGIILEVAIMATVGRGRLDFLKAVHEQIGKELGA